MRKNIYKHTAGQIESGAWHHYSGLSREDRAEAARVVQEMQAFSREQFLQVMKGNYSRITKLIGFVSQSRAAVVLWGCYFWGRGCSLNRNAKHRLFEWDGVHCPYTVGLGDHWPIEHWSERWGIDRDSRDLGRTHKVWAGPKVIICVKWHGLEDMMAWGVAFWAGISLGVL